MRPMGVEGPLPLARVPLLRGHAYSPTHARTQPRIPRRWYTTRSVTPALCEDAPPLTRFSPRSSHRVCICCRRASGPSPAARRGQWVPAAAGNGRTDEGRRGFRHAVAGRGVGTSASSLLQLRRPVVQTLPFRAAKLCRF
jgi:hypothetical protein